MSTEVGEERIDEQRGHGVEPVAPACRAPTRPAGRAAPTPPCRGPAASRPARRRAATRSPRSWRAVAGRRDDQRDHPLRGDDVGHQRRVLAQAGLELGQRDRVGDLAGALCAATPAPGSAVAARPRAPVPARPASSARSAAVCCVLRRPHRLDPRRQHPGPLRPLEQHRVRPRLDRQRQPAHRQPDAVADHVGLQVQRAERALPGVQVVEAGADVAQRCGAPSRARCELGADVACPAAAPPAGAVGPPQSGQLRRGRRRARRGRDRTRARCQRIVTVASAPSPWARICSQQRLRCADQRSAPCRLQRHVGRDDPRPPPGPRQARGPARANRVRAAAAIRRAHAGSRIARLAAPGPAPPRPGAAQAPRARRSRGRSRRAAGTLVVEPRRPTAPRPGPGADRAAAPGSPAQGPGSAALIVAQGADQVTPQQQRVPEVVLGLGLLRSSSPALA